jgi:tetratricopeptide (TPR) repeat protein
MKTLILIGLLCGVAFAEPKTADDWYTEGNNQYNLRAFDKAVEAFKKGFELENDESKKPAYLYNVAQAYRQMKQCNDAVFFYKRYLALKDADTKKPLKADKRKDTEDKIAEEEACAKEQQASLDAKAAEDARIAAEAKAKHDAEGKDKQVATTTPDPTTDVGIDKRVAVEKPEILAVRLTGGGTKISTGGLAVPFQGVVSLTVGHPIKLAEGLALEVGAAFTFAPVPYQDMATQAGHTAQFTTAVADVGVVKQLAPKISARFDLGAGILILGGVGESPFTDGADTTGALVMPTVHVGLSADYAITPNIFATVAPIEFGWSPKKDGLAANISSFEQFDFMVGVGYRM